ncbi:hypothetical protein CDL15_Pgr010212 [Punica granatum]|uniref:Squalene cyclase C-terminal domain-containing protein n=1 Tax=Punica granatum TaxID=22663 RepID=A0A218XQQ9_PUNGR|nr:hypothetical protein CDL15_Pgr010212 [Punica granatum]
MFGTTLSYICMRILGEGPDGGQDNACARARKWILDHGGATYIPSWGKIWLSEDLYYPHPLIQDLLWDSLYIFAEPFLNCWPLNKLRDKALQVTMKHIHYEDENSQYLDIGCVEKVLCMLACWVDDPDGDYFKKHLARIPDYLWIAEDGMKMLSIGSQLWDTAFAIQALLASGLTYEMGPVLARGHDFIKKSQVKDNPFGDFRSMYRHISKGSWTFADRDHGWQVSDCTAEGLKCCLLLSLLPPEIVGEKMEPERLYDAINIILNLQSKNGGVTGWEPAGSKNWLELFNPTEVSADIIIEYEGVECTSATLQALVLFKKFYLEHRTKEIDDFMSNATKYLESIQLPDGGLAAAGKTYDNCVAIRKAVEFLLENQLEDGGWGESYLSCPKKEYVPLEGNTSNLVQTAWALMGLIYSEQGLLNFLVHKLYTHAKNGTRHQAEAKGAVDAEKARSFEVVTFGDVAARSRWHIRGVDWLERESRGIKPFCRKRQRRMCIDKIH